MLLAQFLLSGAFFNVANSPVLQPLSYVTSARWGFAAAASTADLQSLAPRSCGTSAGGRVDGRKVRKTSPSDPSCDPFRGHTSGRWLFDMLMVLLLTVLPLLGATVLVRRVGRPMRKT